MNILIIGLGLIGGSYAKGLIKKGYTIFGVDKSEETLNYAMKNGFLSEASTNPEDFIFKSDVIILGLYPSDIIPYIKKYKHLFNENMIICDVCGIKGNICAEATRLSKPASFIGTHPMAGKEKVGIKFADNEIFKGANFLICPVIGSNERAIDVLKQIANDLEFGKISMMSPEHHDLLIAYTSQLTHLIAVGLVNSDSEKDTINFIGDSYRDLTRIAMINEGLWSELFLENKDNLLLKLEAFQEQLEMIKTALLNDNLELLKELFSSSKKKREAM